MGLKHATTVIIADDGTSPVGSDEWNSDHVVTSDVSFATFKATNLGEPSSSSDAATKNYVDSLISGLKWKSPVRVATTTAGTLSSSFENGDVVDGITLATGDRILIKDQSTGSENGIYTVNASGSPTRATDFDAGSEAKNAAMFVEEGTVNGDMAFVLTNDGTITIGSTSLVFVQFSGLGQITAGDGLAKSANTLSVNVDSSSIEINTDILRVKALGITDAMLAGSITPSKITGTAAILGANTFTADQTLGTNKILGTLHSIGETATANFGIADPIYITRRSGNTYPVLIMNPLGTSNSNVFAMYRTSDVTTNYEIMYFASDIVASNEFALNIVKGGSGTLRPFNFYMSGTKLLSLDVANTVTSYVPLIIDETGTYGLRLGNHDVIPSPTGIDGKVLAIRYKDANTGTFLALLPKATSTDWGGLLYIGKTDFIADTTNFERMYIAANVTSNEFRIVGEKGGTGVDRPLVVSGFSNTQILQDIYLTATKKLYFDGGGDTYIHESSSNNMYIVVGNTTMLGFENGSSENLLKFTNNTTGAGTPSLGTNCPAVTVSAPYTWIKIRSSDGSTVYLPAWK